MGQVMSSHHSDKMSQRSEVSRIALKGHNYLFSVVEDLIVSGAGQRDRQTCSPIELSVDS